ncbi:GerAB/ArcD/ProY family transporter [Lysinibacillus xylanilyticus]|uniref:GerAB/ArcD/ProY family transporter n=1 Tax=Lysinibacillus xylanilyticus TaxID=582475 RepID=UPI003D064947
MKKEIISSRQFTIITLLFTVGTAILIIPSSITNVAKQDAWIATIIGVGLSFLLVKLYVTLGNLAPTLTFIEANEKILGRFFGKLTAIGFSILTFFGAGQLLYFIGNFMSTEVMPETPTMAFSLLFGIIIIFAAFQGIEVFARSAEILFPIFSLVFIVFVVFISPLIHFENLQPILETPKKSLSIGVIRFMSICSFPLVALLILYPSAVNVHKSAQKGFYIGTAIGGIVLIIIVTLCILVIGPSNTANRTFPSYALAQRISIGNFLQRVEVIMAAMWIISIYIKTFMYFYASVISIAQICKIKDHRPLIVPLGMIVIGFSQIIHPDIVHSNTYNNEIWPLFCGTFAILLPIVLLIAAKFRNINGSQGNENVTNCNCCPQNASGSNNGNASNNASNSNSQNAVQNGSNCNCGNASNNTSNSNSQNAEQSGSNCNNGNASNNASNSNSQNAEQSGSNCNNGTASNNASNNNQNATNNASNNNNQNASNNASNNNSQNASNDASNSNSQNASNNTSNNNSQNASNNASNSNSQNASNNASNSNSQNASNNTSNTNSQNAVQSGSNCNNGNTSNNASINNSQNAVQNGSNSNSENAANNASNNNSQNATNNASNNNSGNATTNASTSNSQNTTNNASNNNNQNASNNASNSNSQNTTNNASNNNNQNASTNASNNNSQNATTNASNNNSQNASTNASNNNSQNAAKNKSNTNSQNESPNKNPSEN